MDARKARFEIVLAGTGGQGLILSGMLLAEAAILEGRNVVQTQSYGIASRGGLSLAEVIVDTQEIVFQQVRSPDYVLALSEEAAAKYEPWARTGGPLVYDTTIAARRAGDGFVGRDFTRIAGELGNPGSVNVLALAAVAALTQVVSLASLEHLLRERFRGSALKLNLEMLAVGSGLVES